MNSVLFKDKSLFERHADIMEHLLHCFTDGRQVIVHHVCNNTNTT